MSHAGTETGLFDLSAISSTVDSETLSAKTKAFIKSLTSDGKQPGNVSKVIVLPPNERADSRDQTHLTSFVAAVNGATLLSANNPLITSKYGSGISWWRVGDSDKKLINEPDSVDIFTSETSRTALKLWATAPGISAVMLTAGQDEDTLERYHFLVVQGNDRVAASKLQAKIDEAANSGSPLSLHEATKLPEFVEARRQSKQMRQDVAERAAVSHSLQLLSDTPEGDNETHAVRINATMSSKKANLDEAARSTYIVYSEAVDPASSTAGAMMFRGERAGYTRLYANEKSDADGNPSRSWSNASKKAPFAYFPAHPGSYLHEGSATIRPATHATTKRLRWDGPFNSYNPLSETAYNNNNSEWLRVQSALGAEPGSLLVHVQPLSLVWAEIPSYDPRGLSLEQLVAVSARCSEASFPVKTTSTIVRKIIDDWPAIRSASKKTLAEVFANESEDGTEVHLDGSLFQLISCDAANLK